LPTQTGSYDFKAAKAAHDNLQEQIDPIATKTYTGIIGTANTAVDASFYFAKVHPDDYNGVWQVKLRINVTAPVIYQEIVDVTVSGRASAYMAYDAVSHRSNSALAICYLNLYRAKQAGITAGKGHALGFGLRGSTNPANATYARTITVEVLDQVNCTVQLLDAAVKYANMDGTGTTNYDVLTELYIGAYGQNASNNANTFDRTLYNSNVKAATNLTAGRIVCGNSVGYNNIAAGKVFDVSYPLLYNNTAYNAGGVRADLDLVRVNIAFSNNGTIESAAQHSMVYLKGTIIGNAFTIAASPFMTCKVPTSADGYCYLPLGMLRDSTTNGQFTSSHELWCYKDGAFGPVSLREASQAAKTATNYITKQGSGDTWIHAEGMGPDSSNNPTSTTRGWRIGDALDLFRGTVSMFKAWVDGTVAKVRVGVESAGHAIFTPNGMQVYKAGNLKADYADTITLYGGNAAAGANPKITIGEKVDSVDSLTMYDSGGNRRILMNSSVGLLIGRSDKQHITINDSNVDIYNNASTPTLSARMNADGMSMYRAGSLRAQTTDSGFNVYAKDGKTVAASISSTSDSLFTNIKMFDAQIHVGKNSKSMIITANDDTSNTNAITIEAIGKTSKAALQLTPNTSSEIDGLNIYTNRATMHSSNTAGFFTSTSDYEMSLQIATSGNRGVYDNTEGRWLVFYSGSTGNIYLGPDSRDFDYQNESTTSGQIDLNAGSGASITWKLNVPSGYQFAGIYNVTTNHNQACSIGRFGYSSSNNEATVVVTNRSSTNFLKKNNTGVTASMGVHFIRPVIKV